MAQLEKGVTLRYTVHCSSGAFQALVPKRPHTVMADSSFTPQQDVPSASRVLSLTLKDRDGSENSTRVKLIDVDRMVPVLGTGDTPIIKVYMADTQYLLAHNINVLWR